MAGNTRRASGTDATPRRMISDVGRPVISWPSSQTWPARGRTSPRMTFMVVDLPDAFPPRSATISPASTWSVTPDSAWTGP
jgi:hypothetical protein